MNRLLGTYDIHGKGRLGLQACGLVICVQDASPEENCCHPLYALILTGHYVPNENGFDQVDRPR